MKLFEPVEVEAGNLVRKLVENDEDESWFDDIKDVSELSQEDEWFQVGGDWGNSWVYGGDWYNPGLRQIIHFEGIDYNTEIDPDSIPVPEHMLAKIKSKVHNPYLDSEEAKEDPGWLAKHLEDEEQEIERIVQQYQVARAAFLEVRKLRTFYRAYEFAPDDYFFRTYDAKIAKEFDNPEDYLSWPPYAKMIEIGGRIGWHEIATEVKWNRLEAKAVLGYQKSF